MKFNTNAVMKHCCSLKNDLGNMNGAKWKIVNKKFESLFVFPFARNASGDEGNWKNFRNPIEILNERKKSKSHQRMKYETRAQAQQTIIIRAKVRDDKIYGSTYTGILYEHSMLDKYQFTNYTAFIICNIPPIRRDYCVYTILPWIEHSN